jgi:ribokinase
MPGVDGVRSAMVRLRTRSGLSADRLRSTEVGVEPILELPVVRQIVSATDKSPAEAAVDAIRQIAAQLPTTDLVIVDVVLALRLLGTRFSDQHELEELYAADVGERREQLVAQWNDLHRLLGVDQPPKRPTVRNLRSTLESEAIGKLAVLCVSSSVLDVGQESDNSRATVAVIGSAVMDNIFVIDHLPSAGSASPADSFEESPGGKGLNHAVASARLGMDVHLIAAVGDDERGDRLRDYLVAEGVRVNLIKIAQDARSPVVGVFLLRNGGAFHVPWMNPAEVRLDPSDFHRSAVRATLDAVDAVVLTFELQTDVVGAALESIGRQAVKPLVVVRPSPTLPNPQVLYEHFPKIDYLVGTQSELRDLLPSAKRDMTTEELATSLLMLGVHGICITEEFGCLIRSEYLRADIARFPTAMRDTPGAREAFSAALIYKLLEKNRKINQRDLEWVTAAMAASQSFGGIADSMPVQEQVDRVLEVTPEQSLHD